VGHLDNRAANLKDYSQPAAVTATYDASTNSITDKSSVKFKRILFSVLALGILAGMHYFDNIRPGKKDEHSSSAYADDFERKEPGFLGKTFCRGNRRPKFCSWLQE